MADRLWLGGDLPVRRVGYGALRLTGEEFWRGYPDPAHAVNLLRRAVEWGVELIDTADSYGLGANEELIAEALHPYSEQVVIATKVGQCRPAPGVWIPLGRPEYLRQQAELSLRRLRRAGHRLPRVASGQAGPARRTGQPGRRAREAGRGEPGPGVAGLAAAPVAGDRTHPRDHVAGPPAGQRRRGPAQAPAADDGSA